MRLVDYLDKGASLGADAPCLTMDGKDLSYGGVQQLSYRIAHGLANSGIAPGEKVAILSGNDPIAFASVARPRFRWRALPRRWKRLARWRSFLDRPKRQW